LQVALLELVRALVRQARRLLLRKVGVVLVRLAAAARRAPQD
jgi:hypothetical protein